MSMTASPGLMLVDILTKYHRSLPLDFVAHLVGTSRREIDEYVEELRTRGVVTTHDGEVELVRKAHNSLIR